MKVASSSSVFGPGKKRDLGFFASVVVSPEGLLAGGLAGDGAGGGWSAPRDRWPRASRGAREEADGGGSTSPSGSPPAGRGGAETGSARICGESWGTERGPASRGAL